jgi:hypothetical protein
MFSLVFTIPIAFFTGYVFVSMYNKMKVQIEDEGVRDE